ncbi:MAG: VWA domain-containing protein [bacterium]|nr:VWA domain-containing protein [bacterium]
MVARLRISLTLPVALLLAGGAVPICAVAAPQAAPAAGDAVDEDAPPIDPRDTSELLLEILTKRDAADMVLFDVIGARGDREALLALQQAALAVFSPAGIESAFEAFRWFVGGPLAADALEFLTREAQSGFPYKQRAAVKSLSSFGDASRSALREVFDATKDPIVRQVAVGGLLTELRTAGTKEALAMLLTWYRPPLSGSHELGVRTLSAFKSDECRRLFVKTLRDKRTPGDVQAMVVAALAKIPGEDIDKILRDALRGKDPDVLLATIDALSERGITSHWRELERLERSRDAAVRRAALVAQSAIRPEDEAWTKRVFAAAGHRDFALRMGACFALAALRDASGVARLHELLSDDHHLVRGEAVDACQHLRRKDSIPLLIARMEVETLRLRHRIQKALSSITGLDHGVTHVRWSAWWKAEEQTFAVPRLAEAEKLNTARAKRRAAGATQAAFYGIRVDSDRVCFVLDTSGSMAYPLGPAAAVGIVGTGGESRLEAVQRELTETLHGLPDGARFNLVFFAMRAQRWKKRMIEVEDSTRKASVRHVRQQTANGGTALYDGLMSAFDDEDVDTIFLLSDGQPTEGKIVDPLEILRAVRTENRLRKVVIHCIAVDYTAGLLEALAEETGGDYIEVH